MLLLHQNLSTSQKQLKMEKSIVTSMFEVKPAHLYRLYLLVHFMSKHYWGHTPRALLATCMVFHSAENLPL